MDLQKTTLHFGEDCAALALGANLESSLVNRSPNHSFRTIQRE